MTQSCIVLNGCLPKLKSMIIFKDLKNIPKSDFLKNVVFVSMNESMEKIIMGSVAAHKKAL